ncbi:hypothetical protein F5I97DRAFT_2053044 [Phlebopus sp. FC_14]|nr:hypothetical protein F5I97DRAFT_2053044 [Phlebopus sp. FC_14]
MHSHSLSRSLHMPSFHFILVLILYHHLHLSSSKIAPATLRSHHPLASWWLAPLVVVVVLCRSRQPQGSNEVLHPR